VSLLTSSLPSARDAHHHSLDSPIIHVKVGGDNGKIIPVHQALLTSTSGYFQDALRNQLQGPHIREIALPFADPDAFMVYSKFLYTLLFCVMKQGDRLPQDANSANDLEWNRLAMCYQLGSLLRDVDFKDATIDAMIEKMIVNNAPLVPLASAIYPFSNPESPHRELARDIFLVMWPRCRLVLLLDNDQPYHFRRDVLTMIGQKLEHGIGAQTIPGYFAGQENGCLYHEHARTNAPCYKICEGR
jgi:hypothetical protein